MAASHATGAAQDGYDLRRRNVPSPTKSNGSVTSPETETDEKKSQKVGVRLSYDRRMLTATPFTAPIINLVDTQRI